MSIEQRGRRLLPHSGNRQLVGNGWPPAVPSGSARVLRRRGVDVYKA